MKKSVLLYISFICACLVFGSCQKLRPPTLPGSVTPSATASNTPAVFPTSTPFAGGKIVYSAGGGFSIVSSDGTGNRAVYTGTVQGWYPDLSNDGKKIVFNNYHSIYTVPEAGGEPVLITTQGGLSSWSHDGTKIAFNSYRDGNWEIYTMNADGSGQTRLTSNTVEDGSPRWSRDGSRIVYASEINGNYKGDFDIYMMNADGTGNTRLTYCGGNTGYPAWSPSADVIVHVQNTFKTFIIDPAGNTLQQLPSPYINISWSPDGSRLVYSSSLGPYATLAIVNNDGTNTVYPTSVISNYMLYVDWGQ